VRASRTASIRRSEDHTLFRTRLCGLALLAWPAVVSLAAEPPNGASPLALTVPVVANAADSLTLAGAIADVLRENPTLKSADYALRAQDARRDQANLKPAWHATLEAENFLGDSRVHGIDALETTLRLGTVIERGGKRGRRVAEAEGDRALLAADQDVVRLDLLAETARRFIHVVADQEALMLTHRATALSRRSQQLVDQRVRAAKMGDAESGKAAIALARAEIGEEHAEHELKSARVALVALWNTREPGFERADAAFFELPEPESLDALVAALDANPALARFASAQRVEDARVALARSSRTADIAFNAGVRRLEAGNDHGLVFSVTVPLGSAQRAAPYEREAEIRRDAIDVQAAAVRADLYRTLYALYQELLHARTQADTLRERVIPEAERTLKATENGFAVGRYSYLEFVDAQQQLLTVQREAVDAARDYHLFFVEIERLAGRALGVDAAATEKRS
jgi:cobalt-zinc-cadmium efflux system outer membrane protein